MTKRDEAMKYAKVEFVGLNRMGEEMYAADSPWLLEQREVKMKAFEAGWESAIEECARFVETCSGPDAKTLGDLIRKVKDGGGTS